jgi:quinol monooxygenase YgiN
MIRAIPCKITRTSNKEMTTMKLREVDERITYAQQLQEDSGPVVLINEFNVGPQDVERFLEVWADNLAVTKQQPGLISMQAYRGAAGSTTFGMIAVWESAKALGQAFLAPEFQALAANYPDSTVAAPHVFKKLAIPGVCVA